MLAAVLNGYQNLISCCLYQNAFARALSFFYICARQHLKTFNKSIKQQIAMTEFCDYNYRKTILLNLQHSHCQQKANTGKFSINQLASSFNKKQFAQNLKTTLLKRCILFLPTSHAKTAAQKHNEAEKTTVSAREIALR